MAEYFGTTVSDILDTMEKRFIPEAAKDVDVRFGYEIAGEGGGNWMVTIQRGTLKIENIKNKPSGCHVTIITDAKAFVGLALGEIDTAEVLSSGKVKIDGDMTLLITILPKIFKKYEVPVKHLTARNIIATAGSRFRPDKAQGIDMRIGYDLEGDGGGQWTLHIKDEKFNLSEGLADNLTVKMMMSANVYVGMMTGTLDPTMAFTSGQVKIEGDLMAASATAKFFNKYVDPTAKEAEELICVRLVNSIDQRFATGPVMGKWFAGLKEKKFLANKCPKCGRTQIPPREICAICRVRVNKFVEVGPNGTVTNSDICYFASPDPLTGIVRNTPYAAVFVILDGATEQEAFAHEIKVGDISRMRVGTRVRPVWAEKTTGSYKDILYFEIDD